MERPVSGECRRGRDVVAPGGGGDVVVRAEGELDLATAPVLVRAASAALSTSSEPRLVVDLSAVTFIDAAGLRALLRVADRAAAARRDVMVIEPAGAARRIFELLREAVEGHTISEVVGAAA